MFDPTIALPVGSLVTQSNHLTADGDLALFIVEDFWRGEPRLRHLATGTTHVAPLSEVVVVSTPQPFTAKDLEDAGLL